jgi:hypothetical protein
MSDVIPTPACDPAIDIIDEQVAALNSDIAANTRRVELDTGVRDRLLAVRAVLARKLRVRTPRAVARPAPSIDQPDAPANDAGDASPRPTVFATPSLVADAA